MYCSGTGSPAKPMATSAAPPQSGGYPTPQSGGYPPPQTGGYPGVDPAKMRPKSEDVSRFNQPQSGGGPSLAYQGGAQQPGSQPALQGGWAGAASGGVSVAGGTGGRPLVQQHEAKSTPTLAGQSALTCLPF